MVELLCALFVVLSTNAIGQVESFSYCFSPDHSLVINKVNQEQFGDSVIKTFHEDYGNSEYQLLHLNDTLYSEYNGSYYFLGTNTANVGDLWYPLRYHFMSFTDSSTTCANPMNLEVTAVNQLFFDGMWINEIALLDLDLEYNVSYTFLEGIGITAGGPLYNLAQQFTCDIIFDFAQPKFRFYQRDAAIHFGPDTCSFVGIEEIEMQPRTLVKIVDLMGRETEHQQNGLRIHIYSDGTREKVWQLE